MKDAQKIFAETCRRLREQAGMTQEKLGEAAGITGAYVSEIERGNANPTLATIQKLADGLNVDIAVLADFRDTELTEEQIKANLIREISRANNRTIKDLHSLIKKAFP